MLLCCLVLFPRLKHQSPLRLCPTWTGREGPLGALTWAGKFPSPGRPDRTAAARPLSSAARPKPPVCPREALPPPGALRLPRIPDWWGFLPAPCGSKRVLDARGAWLRGSARDPPRAERKSSERPFPPPAVPRLPPPADQLPFAAALTVTHPFLTCVRPARWGILSAQTREPCPVQVEAPLGLGRDLPRRSYVAT